MRAAVSAVVVVVLVLVAGACGVPTGDGTYSAIAPEEVPFRLNEVATTTTSTTTTTTTTEPPPEQPETTAEQTTTTVAPTESVEVYFLSRDDLLPVLVQFPSPYSGNELVSQLEAGPPDGPAAELGLETLIDPGLVVDTSAAGGIVTVFLDENVYSEIDPGDRMPAIAQIVLTLLSNLTGVGLVAFMLDDEPLRVLKANGLLADEGEAVARDDYRELIAGEPDSPTSTSEPEDATLDDEPTDTDAATSTP